MIILVYGNVGSGKTASIIKDVVTKMNKMPTYSNVTMMKPVPNVIPIKAEMIINKEVIGQKKNGDEITKLTLNQQFWKDVPKPCNVILDEAHNLLNSRRSTSSVNVIMGDFIALLRRVLGESSYVGGDLILITQLERRIDVIAKEMAHQVRYYLCHYHKTCEDCGLDVKENSDTPEQMKYCYNCGDGCCTNYGTTTTVNGKELDLHNQDVATILRQVLTELGYEAEIIETYNGE